MFAMEQFLLGVVALVIVYKCLRMDTVSDGYPIPDSERQFELIRARIDYKDRVDQPMWSKGHRRLCALNFSEFYVWKNDTISRG